MKLNFTGNLKPDSYNILLRNKDAINVAVACDVTILGETRYGGITINFEPDQEFLDFLQKKLEQAVSEGKASSSPPYLQKKER